MFKNILNIYFVKCSFKLNIHLKQIFASVKNQTDTNKLTFSDAY